MLVFLVVNKREDVDILFSKTDSIGGGYKIYATTFEARMALLKRKSPFLKYSDFVTIEDYSDIDNEAGILAKNWYNRGGLKEILLFRNIHLGKLLELRIHNYLAEVVRSIRVIEVFLKKEKPEKIVIVKNNIFQSLHFPSNDFNLEYEAIILLADLYHIPLERIEEHCFSVRKNLLESIKKHFRKNKIVKSLYLKLCLVKSFLGHPLRLITEIKVAGLLACLYILRIFKSPKIEIKSVKSVFFYGRAYQVRNAIPLIKVIAEERGLSINVLVEKITGDTGIELVKNSIIYEHIDKTLSNEMLIEIEREKDYISNEWDRIKNDRELTDFFITRNKISFWKVIENVFADLFKNGFVEAIKYVAIFHKFLEVHKPALCLTMADTDCPEMSLVLLAQEKLIPTLVVQHGICVIPSNYDFISEKKAVWGNLPRDWFIKTGKKAERMEITGYPFFDSYSDIRCSIDRNKILNELGFSAENQVALFLSIHGGGIWKTYHFSDGEEIFRVVFREIKDNFPDLRLIVKQHPAENKKMPGFIADEIGLNICVNPRMDIKKLICLSDVVLVQNSTVALEVMLLQKPIIYLNLFCRPDLLPFAHEGAAIGVYSAAELVPAIQNLLGNKELFNKYQENQKNFIYNYCYKIDGNASHRVCLVAKKMIYEDILKSKALQNARI